MSARLRTWWRAMRRRSRFESDLDEELRNQIDLRAADLSRRGIAPAEALRQARLELGSAEARKEECRASMGLRWWDELRQDLRYAFRVLGRSPAFTAVAVLSLAFGIGANTAVFSVLNTLLLKPLPLSGGDRLYTLQNQGRPSQSFPNYRDLRDRNTSFSGLAALRVMQAGLESDGTARRVWGYLVTGNYFEVLGLRPAAGRFFGPSDDRLVNGSTYVVLSYNCWQNRFAGDPQIVGRTVRVNALPYVVLGVAPRGFHGTELFYWPDIWVPMSMQPVIEGHSWLEERNSFNSWLIGRLKDGLQPGQADAELGALSAALAREYPQSNEGLHVTVARPGLLGDGLRKPIQAFLAGVMVLAALVLLAACANLASLMSARAADRHRELAIRQSIGAGRGRIFRQLASESLLLSLLGGAAGCLLAVALIALLNHWRAPLDFPVQFALDLDLRVFGFALAVSVATGLLFGIGSARQAWKADPQQALKGASQAAGRRWAFRDLLLATQVTLCCVLVMSSFVAFRGLARTFEIPLGFQAAGVSVAGFDLTLAHYTPEEGRALQRRALEAAAQLPGAIAAAYSNSVPLSIDQNNTTVFPDGITEFRPAFGVPAAVEQISPGYMRAMGTRLIAGREFTWHDDAKAPRVAIVNETFARKVLHSTDVVGRRFLEFAQRPVEIVGVVEDGKCESLTEAPCAALFQSALQQYNSTSVLILRSRLSDSEATNQLRRTLTGLDPRLPLYSVGSLTQMLGFAFFPAHAATVALSCFGVLAVMLALTGIYGLASYAVSRRLREIGIRMALGARPSQVQWFVLGRIGMLVCVGSLAGLGLGAAAGRLLSNVVYQATSRDPLVLLTVPAAMALIGLAATWGPARRALSVDPLRSLRQE